MSVLCELQYRHPLIKLLEDENSPLQSEEAGNLAIPDRFLDLIGRLAQLEVVRVLVNQVERNVNLFESVCTVSRQYGHACVWREGR